MSVVTTLPFGRALTRADLDRLPDDGHRYELVDGTLIVSPSPAWRHQRAVGALFLLLQQACDASLEVLPGPFDVVLGEDTVIVPDVLVARVTDLTERALPAAPLLAVEVLSRSTRRVDLLLKRSRLEAAGAPSYWLVDPDEPSLTVLELHRGRYEQVAHVVGDQAWTASRPCPVTVVPSALVASRRATTSPPGAPP